MVNRKELAEKIIKLRNLKEYSQRKLAMVSDVSNSTISRIENATSDADPETLKKLAPCLNISYEELMVTAGYLKEYSNINQDTLDDEEERKMVIKLKNEFYTFIIDKISDNSQITDKLKHLLDKYNAFDQNLKQPELEEVIEKFVNDLMPNTNIIKCEEMLDDLGYEDRWIWENDVNKPIIFLKEKYQTVDDIEEAMKIILEQPGLMLKGELLSDESKIILANAIQMGLRTAEELEKKKNKGDTNE